VVWRRFWWVRSLLTQLLTFLIVLFLIFALIYLAGGTTVMPTDRRADIKRVERPENPTLLELPTAYLAWLGNAARLDFGQSGSSGKD